MEILYAKPCRIFMAHSWMSKRPDNAHVWLLSPYSSCFCGFDIYHSRLNVVLKLPPPPLPPSPRPTRLIPRPTPLFPRFTRLARETAGVSFCTEIWRSCLPDAVIRPSVPMLEAMHVAAAAGGASGSGCFRLLDAPPCTHALSCDTSSFVFRSRTSSSLNSIFWRSLLHCLHRSPSKSSCVMECNLPSFS